MDGASAVRCREQQATDGAAMIYYLNKGERENRMDASTNTGTVLGHSRDLLFLNGRGNSHIGLRRCDVMSLSHRRMRLQQQLSKVQ